METSSSTERSLWGERGWNGSWDHHHHRRHHDHDHDLDRDHDHDGLGEMTPEQYMQFEYMRGKMHVLQQLMLAGYAIMSLLCFLFIAYLRYNRQVAFTGDANAARKIILPAFEPLLWILAIATGIFALFFSGALSADLYVNDIPEMAVEFFYAERQFAVLLVHVFLYQKSVSLPALRRTVLITIVLSCYTIPFQYFLRKHVRDDPTANKYDASYWEIMGIRMLLLLFYIYVLIWPPNRATARSVRVFTIFSVIYQALQFTYNELYRQGSIDLAFTVADVTVLWASLAPLFVWCVLVADTEFWRGMGQRACSLQMVLRQKNGIHERVSSQGLHVLIEMHRKYIIDFAYLELKQRIGMGASAVVFNGLLHSTTPVAVKVYTPIEFTDDTVAEFSQEAALCGALNHPNIVKFYGMCVCPPTICLVSELCQGSLDDNTCTQQRRRHDRTRRQQLLINLGYMIDAARAVAYIHSFSPPFIHRDIKPQNFLVDTDNTVKLTDFGESRSLPKQELTVRKSHRMSVLRATDQQAYAEFPTSPTRIVDEVSASDAPAVDPRSSLNAFSERPLHLQAQMTVRGTADYMAPEIIQGKGGIASYGEAADVYSLAITMWDVLYRGVEKFPSLNNNYLKVMAAVSSGLRPLFLDDRYGKPALREVIESAWDADPRLRPSAQNLVSILEGIQEEALAVFAADLSEEMHASSVAQPSEVVFTGEHAISLMQVQQYVSSANEGVRLGNALMEAGFLHHLKHMHSFEHSDEQFFFDDEAIHLCKPLGNDASNGSDQQPVLFGTDGHITSPSQNHKRVRSTVSKAGSKGGSSGSGQSACARARACTTSKPAHRRVFAFKGDSTHFSETNGVCACRKYGKRTVHHQGAYERRRFRRRCKTVIEESNISSTSQHDSCRRNKTADVFDTSAVLGDTNDWSSSEEDEAAAA